MSNVFVSQQNDYHNSERNEAVIIVTILAW